MDAEVISWFEVAATLGQFNRHQVADTVAANLRASLPASGRLVRDWRARQPLIEATQAAIRASAGAWYTLAGIEVGGERLGGWCWCHSFCNLAGQAPFDTVVSDGAAGVADQVAAVHAYLRALEAHFASENTADVEALIDIVVDHSDTHDAWYTLLSQALCWLAHARGLDLTAQAEHRLETVVRENCTSWTEPERPANIVLEAHALLAELTPVDVDLAVQLEVQIANSPDDPAPYLVLADLLTARGDIRGELIARQAQGASYEDLLDEPALWPEDAPPRSYAEWHLGFWQSLTVDVGDASIVDALEHLLTHPSARVLRHLDLPGALPQRGLSSLVRCARTLASLSVGELLGTHPDLGLLATFPRLRAVHLWSTRAAVASLAPLKVLPLRSLTCRSPDAVDDGYAESLKGHPTLRHVGLGRVSPRGAHALGGLPQLRSVALERVGDDVVAALVQAVPGLVAVDLRRCQVTEAALGSLTGLARLRSVEVPPHLKDGAKRWSGAAEMRRWLEGD